VNRIEGSNRFAWKRLPGAINYFANDPQDVPMRSYSRQLCAAIRRLRLRQFAQIDRSDQHTVALNERQVGCNDNLGFGQQLTHDGRGLFVQEPREDGA
jgi:hypothetical protein